jgi:hypothetical protein
MKTHEVQIKYLIETPLSRLVKDREVALRQI